MSEQGLKKRFVVVACVEDADFGEVEELLNGGYRVKSQASFCLAVDGVNVGKLVYVLELEGEDEVSSIKSVDINEADQWIREGYVVHETFARTVTLVKKENMQK